MTPPSSLVTRGVIAKILGVSVARVKQLHKRGDLKHKEVVNETYYFDRAVVEAYARKRGVAPNASVGKLAARVFAMFRAGAGMRLPDVVIETQLDPKFVEQLYEQYRAHERDENGLEQRGDDE